MKLVGIEVVILTWQGPLATFQHSTATQMAVECGEQGLGFMLLLDPWCARLGSGSPTVNVENALNDPTTQAMLTTPAYVKEKYILDFNSGADLTQLKTAFPTLSFLGQSTGFSWPMIPWSASSYLAMNKNPSMKIPGVCLSFNDAGMPTPSGVNLGAWTGTRDYSQSVWGGAPARVLDDQAGEFFSSQLLTITKTMPYIALVTWNDYDERSSGPLESTISVINGIEL